MFWKIFNSIIVPVFILVPISIGIFKYKILPVTLKTVWFYLVITAVVNTAATIIGRVFHSNNMPLLHLFTLIEGVMFIWYYKRISGNNAKNKWFNFLLTAFVIVCILNALFFQSIYAYSSYTRYVESIICILFALNFFAKIAALDNRPTKVPDFYFNTGIFLYFSGSFTLFIFSNFILQKLSASTMLIFWSGHSSLVLLMYLFFSIGFIICKK